MHYLGLFSFKKSLICHHDTKLELSQRGFQVSYILNKPSTKDVFLQEKELKHILNYYHIKNKNYKKALSVNLYTVSTIFCINFWKKLIKQKFLPLQSNAEVYFHFIVVQQNSFSNFPKQYWVVAGGSRDHFESDHRWAGAILKVVRAWKGLVKKVKERRGSFLK